MKKIRIRDKHPGSADWLYRYGTFQNNYLLLMQTGVHGVARSMPTSAAVDRVAAKKGGILCSLNLLFFFLIVFSKCSVYRTSVCSFGSRLRVTHFWNSVLDTVERRGESSFGLSLEPKVKSGIRF
jgi:hypothetical protein